MNNQKIQTQFSIFRPFTLAIVEYENCSEWGTVFSMLSCKLSRKGGRLIKVNPTSQTCPVCGQISKVDCKSQAVFKCVACGYENNADLVAAFNMLQKGKENPNQTLLQGLREVTLMEYGKVLH